MAELTGQRLRRIIESSDVQIFQDNRRYFRGENTTIVNKVDQKPPDNRIPLPLARRTVKDIVGYAFKPGNVTYEFSEDTEEKTIEEIEAVFKKNDVNLVSGEVFEDALVNGEGAELMYYSGDELHIVQVPREQCIFNYFDEIKPRLEFSIRFFSVVVINDQGDKEKKDKAEVYWSDKVEFYETMPRKIYEDDPQAEREQDGNNYNDYRFVKDEIHGFGEPPLYPYRVASDKLGVFQPYKKIIDILDDFGSDKIANALQRFAEDFMAMSKKISPEVAEKIKEFRIFDNLGDKKEGNFVEFINRQLDIESSVQGFKLYERLYYDLIGVPNLNDEKFEGKSGIAMLFALVPFENLVSGFEIYFNQGLQHRLKLINTLFGSTKSLSPAEAEINWVRNLPADIDKTVENVVALKNSGLLSDETLIKMFPAQVIADAEQEIERREKEKEQRIETALNAERNFIEEEQEE